MLLDENKKNVIINGTNNRYLIKRANRVVNVPKKRAIINKYNLPMEDLDFNKQTMLLKEIFEKNGEISKEKEIIIKEIDKKISSYKQQDILKKMYNETKFINFKNIIQNMIECDLKCRYCKEEMLVIYDLLREQKQWSVDRVNNNEGHNIDNYYLSCLKCNLKKRRTSDEKFLFTKQLNIIKYDS